MKLYRDRIMIGAFHGGRSTVLYTGTLESFYDQGARAGLANAWFSDYLRMEPGAAVRVMLTRSVEQVTLRERLRHHFRR